MTRTHLAFCRDLRHGIRSSIRSYETFMKPIFAEVGLDMYEGNMLIELGRRDGKTAAELSRTVNTGTQGLQHTWNGLIRKGLVQWRKHIIERRRRMLHLTDEGKETLATIEGLVLKSVGETHGLPIGSDAGRLPGAERTHQSAHRMRRQTSDRLDACMRPFTN